MNSPENSKQHMFKKSVISRVNNTMILFVIIFPRDLNTVLLKYNKNFSCLYEISIGSSIFNNCPVVSSICLKQKDNDIQCSFYPWFLILT